MITYETSDTSLTFIADDEAREELSEILSEKGYPEALSHLIEQVIGNGLEAVRPEDIGGLTDAPIFGLDVERDDEGTILDCSQAYWFPDYAVINELEVLAETGKVVFPAAPEPAPVPGM